MATKKAVKAPKPIGKNQKPGGKPTTPTTPEPPKKKSGKKK